MGLALEISKADLIHVYLDTGSNRSRTFAVARTLERGFQRLGYKNVKIVSAHEDPAPARLLAFYGLAGREKLFDSATRDQNQHILFADLAYWGRISDPALENSQHRLVLNGLYAQPHVLREAARLPLGRLGAVGGAMPPPRSLKPATQSRWAALGMPKPCVLVAGMSAKAAEIFGWLPQEWELNACHLLRDNGFLPIYRPKPSWVDARRIECAEWDRGTELSASLSRCVGVVTHHSNVALEAMALGIPFYCEEGPARPWSVSRYSGLAETPRFMPDDTEHFLNGLAWTQFSNWELVRGKLSFFLGE